MIERVNLFTEFDLIWWTKELIPILQNIAAVVGGHEVYFFSL